MGQFRGVRDPDISECDVDFQFVINYIGVNDLADWTERHAVSRASLVSLGSFVCLR